jgi:heptosyltransferase-2/heptosyltransferase-3
MAGNPRPLVMRCGAFGDMVLLTPLIRELAARFGAPVDLVSSGAWTTPLLAGQPGVGAIHLLQSRRRPYLISPDQWRVVSALRRRPPGPTWFLDADGVGRSLLTRGGIGPEWVVEADQLPRQPGEHYLERFWRIADRMPAALAAPPPPLPARAIAGTVLEVPAASRRDLDAWLAAAGLAGRRLLLVQAGNKRTMRRGDRRRASNTKYWPEERWARVVDAMAERCPEHAVLLLGVPSEHALNEEIRALTRAARVHNVAADLPVPRLVALLERADAMVTVDTGPAHAAAAVGLPLVVLFGAAEPSLYRPWGAPGAAVLCLRAEPPGPLEGLDAAAAVAAFATLPLRGAAAG